MSKHLKQEPTTNGHVHNFERGGEHLPLRAAVNTEVLAQRLARMVQESEDRARAEREAERIERARQHSELCSLLSDTGTALLMLIEELSKVRQELNTHWKALLLKQEGQAQVLAGTAPATVRPSPEPCPQVLEPGPVTCDEPREPAEGAPLRPVAPVKRRRNISPEGRARMAEAARQRWAKKKAQPEADASEEAS